MSVSENDVMLSGDETDTEGNTELMAELKDNMDADMEKVMIRICSTGQWASIEASLDRLHKEVSDLKTENESLRKKLSNAEGRITRTERKLNEANEKIVDLTSRSMKDNLIFKNIEEKQGEDLDKILRQLFMEKLKMPEHEARSINIDKVHRSIEKGKTRPRNVIAKFLGSGKTKVMSHLKHLSRDDELKVTEQFPPEVNERRNKLWPQFIDARKAGKEAKFKVDKLIIDKKTISAPEDTIRDINMDVTAKAMEMEAKHTQQKSVAGSHYQGHVLPVDTADDVIPAIQALCRNPAVAGATNLTYAYRIGHDRHYISNYHDDGNWGSGREILRMLDQTDTFNYLVAITRWCGSRPLEPSRFQQARDVAKEAVNLITRRG